MLTAFPQAMPVNGLIGGLMIGCAAALMLFGLGRIAGVSGLLARSVGIADGGPPWRVAVAFVIGLPLGAMVVQMSGHPVVTHFPGLVTLIIGGLIVGFGTRMGSGCTSGHGVCGMSRLSPRSLAATATFMALGFITVGLMRAFGLGL